MTTAVLCPCHRCRPPARCGATAGTADCWLCCHAAGAPASVNGALLLPWLPILLPPPVPLHSRGLHTVLRHLALLHAAAIDSLPAPLFGSVPLAHSPAFRQCCRLWCGWVALLTNSLCCLNAVLPTLLLALLLCCPLTARLLPSSHAQADTMHVPCQCWRCCPCRHEAKPLPPRGQACHCPTKLLPTLLCSIIMNCVVARPAPPLRAPRSLCSAAAVAWCYCGP